MGCWGMGLTQSDEFCEVYENFMERYNEGEDVREISASILGEYLSEFDEDDGILHDVFFALAKAEWMCCCLSTDLLSKVTEIIESGTNIDFLRSLEATESDLRRREKNLSKFLISLQTPKSSPRKRRPEPKEKPLPPVDTGDCLAYKHGDGWRVVVVLERLKSAMWREMLFCCILGNDYDSLEIDVENESVGKLVCYTSTEFLAKSNIRKFASLPVTPGAKDRIIGANSLVLGLKSDFHGSLSSGRRIPIKELLKAEDN